MRSSFDSKYFVIGLAVVGAASGCADTELAATSQAEAGSVCAYVAATVGGQLVTTPSIAVIIPDGSLQSDELRVHVDETEQEIIGYSVRTPGVDRKVAGQDLFVPGPGAHLPSFSVSLPEVGATKGTCLAAGVATPAVPIHIPASTLQIPGAAVDVPEITVTHLGKQVTTPGRTLFLPGRTIILPSADAVVPPITVETQDRSVSVELDATYQPPSPLPPAILLAPSL